MPSVALTRDCRFASLRIPGQTSGVRLVRFGQQGCVSRRRQLQDRRVQQRAGGLFVLATHSVASQPTADCLTSPHDPSGPSYAQRREETRDSRIRTEVRRLSLLLAQLAELEPVQKIKILEADERVQDFFCMSRHGLEVSKALSELPFSAAYVVLCLLAIGQEHILCVKPAGERWVEALSRLAEALVRVENFYNSIGGIVGYQLKCLSLMVEAEAPCSSVQPQGTPPAEAVRFHMPAGVNLAGPDGEQVATQAAATGLEALPHMAEIYPLGGAGDRLGLKCDLTGESVPTAMLPYCGRTLLDGLIRDLQAREYLYYKLYGKQQMTPVVIMTSDAKDNHRRVLELLEHYNWFGRGRDSFRVFRQPLVPVLSAEDGQWLLPEPMRPLMKPGGHGAIWKLMLDEGVFTWLGHRDREAAIVRQISNPIAGADATLLALAGTGYSDARSFGFACCERAVGASEGMNVLMERVTKAPGGSGWEHAYNVTNLEYTEFERLGICDEACAEGSRVSRFPANTNVLYIGLKAAEAAVRAGVRSGGGAALPGLIFNTKKRVEYECAASGERRSVNAGRMECTMQNLVDSLPQRFRDALPPERHATLDTFVVFETRRKVTSSAKRRRAAGSTSLAQTPDGSFLDLMRNAHQLLGRCGFRLPPVGEVEEYLERGPGFIFLFHPALGPLWDVIAQKLRGGSLAHGSELVLEVAEAAVSNLSVEGSLLVRAAAPVGQLEHALAVNYNQIRSHIDIQVNQLNGRRLLYEDVGQGEGSAPRWELTQVSGAAPLEAVALQGGAAAGGWAAAQPRPQALTDGARDDGDGRRLVYSSRCGRVRLADVVVRNRGIDWGHPDNVYWRHKVHRHERAEIVLHGQSEFDAAGVTLCGDVTYEVPDGHRMTVRADAAGRPRAVLTPLSHRQPSWEWGYVMGPRGQIQLNLEEGGARRQAAGAGRARQHSDEAFSYII